MNLLRIGDELEIGPALTVRFQWDHVVLVGGQEEIRLDVDHAAMLAQVLTYCVNLRRGRYSGYGHAGRVAEEGASK